MISKPATIEEVYRYSVMSEEWKKLKKELIKIPKAEAGLASFNYKGWKIEVEKEANTEMNEKQMMMAIQLRMKFIDEQNVESLLTK